MQKNLITFFGKLYFSKKNGINENFKIKLNKEPSGEIINQTGNFLISLFIIFFIDLSFMHTSQHEQNRCMHFHLNLPRYRAFSLIFYLTH